MEPTVRPGLAGQVAVKRGRDPATQPENNPEEGGEVWAEPAFGFLQGPALALRVVGDLVLAHPADHEVLRLRVREIPAADGSTGPHRHRLGQLDAGPLPDVHQLPERRLFGVLRAGRVAGGRADSHVIL